MNYKEMIQRIAASKYRDLGNERLCGDDLVLMRTPRELRDQVSDLLSRNQRIPETVENEIYPTTAHPDIVKKYDHGMTLSDGSPWGGDNTFTITANIGAHAQLRMDQRCIDTEDIFKILEEIASNLEKMWVSGDFESYKKLFMQLVRGMTDKDAYKSKVGGGIKLVLAPIVARFHEDTIKTRKGNKILPVPSSDLFAMKVVSVFGGSKERLTPEMENRIKCENFLKEKGYTLLPKTGPYRRASVEDTLELNINFDIDHGSMKMKDGSRWGGIRVSGLRFLFYVQEKYSEDVVNVLVNALYKHIRTNIEAPWNKGDFDTYNKNFEALTQGLDVVTPERYRIKMVKKWDTPHTFVDNGGTSVMVPDGVGRTYYVGYSYDLEVTYASGTGRTREEDLEEQKINLCMENLKDYYTIVPPKS